MIYISKAWDKLSPEYTQVKYWRVLFVRCKTIPEKASPFSKRRVASENVNMVVNLNNIGCWQEQ